MAQPPHKDRHRPHPPVQVGDYAGALLQELVTYFGEYRYAPDPGRFGEVMRRIHVLQLLARPEHRFGVAGAVHAIMSLHPLMCAAWRKSWPREMHLMDACKPADADAEVSRPPEIDYLWMYGTTSGDEYTIDRILNIAQRTDTVGEAALLVCRYHAEHHLMLDALARAAGSTTTAPPVDRSVPTAMILRLAQHAAEEPLFQQCVLYVGWRHSPAALVARTPDGTLPAGFPTEWEGHQVVVEQATAAELEQWRKICAEKERP